MQAWHFSENAYHLLPDAKDYSSIRVTLPNRYYDPDSGPTCITASSTSGSLPMSWAWR